MKLVQMLLPLYYNNGEKIPEVFFNNIRDLLINKFKGITAYSRSPATGLWKEDGNKTFKDDIVVYEVMTEDIDHDFWSEYKKQLEVLFDQIAIIIRVSDITVL